MRHRIIRYAFILLLALATSQPPIWPVPVQAPNPAGHLEQVSRVLVIHLQGKPYEMGVQQGTLLRDQLRNLVRYYLHEHIILERGASHFWLLTYARLFEREIPTALRSEMEGIADGAGLSYQDVLLLNTVPDLLALTCGLPSWELSPSLFSSTVPQSSLFCAAFAAWGRATLDGELTVGYNTDCVEAELLSRYLLVVVRRPSQGNAFVSLGLMGMVGVWAGMNEEKITAMLLSSPSVDVASSGQPLPFLLRRVLESAGDLAEAVNVILAASRLCGGNVILGDGKAPGALVIELSAHRHAVFEANTESDLLACTNHFLDPELALAQRHVVSAQERATSEARLDRLQTLLEFNSGWIGVEKGLAFLRDDHDPQGSAGSSSDRTVYGPRTLQSALFCPGNLTIWVARGNFAVPLGQYVNLDLSSSLLGRH